MAKKITDSYGHGVQQVGYEKVGKKRLFTDPDADIARKHFHTKSRRMINKTTTLKEAVGKFVHNGCYFAAGGFGSNRIPVAVLHEIVRQKKKNLGFAAQGSTHDLQILLAGQCINRCDTVYSEGLKSGGISTVYRNKYKKNDLCDAGDDYGKSKAKISKLIINKFKNTKIIRTSIIGHETSEKKYSLLDWFLSSDDFVYGFQNHYWNGITTLEWAKLSEKIITDWDMFNKLTQVGIDGLSKYELLKIIKSVYNKEIEIGEKITEKTVNKMLETDIVVKNIKIQLIELKNFFNK